MSKAIAISVDPLKGEFVPEHYHDKILCVIYS